VRYAKRKLHIAERWVRSFGSDRPCGFIPIWKTQKGSPFTFCYGSRQIAMEKAATPECEAIGLQSLKALRECISQGDEYRDICFGTQLATRKLGHPSSSD